MKNAITMFAVIALISGAFVQMDTSGDLSEKYARLMLLIGVLHLLYFQIWIINKWRAIGPQHVTVGLWLISSINLIDISLCTYAFFDLSIIYDASVHVKNPT